MKISTNNISKIKINHPEIEIKPVRPKFVPPKLISGNKKQKRK